MKFTIARPLYAASLLCVASASAAPRRLPPKPEAAACLKASETAQSLEHAGKLVEASTAFGECAQAKCPDVIASDCTQAIERLKSRIPTLSLRVQDNDHHDILGARVSLDGEAKADALNGASMAVNPGTHTLKVEADGFVDDTRSVLVTTGEQDRVIAVVLSRVDERPPSSASGAGPWPWVMVGAGVALAGAGTYVMLSAPGFPTGCVEGRANSCKDAASAKQATDHSNAQSNGLLLLAGGGVAVAGGLLWYFLTPAEETSRQSFVIRPSVGAFNGISASGSF